MIVRIFRIDGNQRYSLIKNQRSWLVSRQLMPKHRVLSLKPQLRLEWRGQDGHNETEQTDHSASLGDSITSATRIRFSVHTGRLARNSTPLRVESWLTVEYSLLRETGAVVVAHRNCLTATQQCQPCKDHTLAAIAALRARDNPRTKAKSREPRSDWTSLRGGCLACPPQAPGQSG